MANERLEKRGIGQKKQEAINALLHPGSVEDAAREAGVTTNRVLKK